MISRNSMGFFCKNSNWFLIKYSSIREIKDWRLSTSTDIKSFNNSDPSNFVKSIFPQYMNLEKKRKYCLLATWFNIITIYSIHLILPQDDFKKMWGNVWDFYDKF